MTSAKPNDNNGATAPLPRNPSTMLWGWLLRAELQKLAASRRERGDPIDWVKWSYAAAATLDAIRPGRDRIVMMASGRPYAGRYFRTWAECLPQNLFCEGKNRLALTLEEVPDDVLRAAEAACRLAGKRRHRTFLKGATIARLLAVTSAERERLGLRIIRAMDADNSKLKGATVERKRERDRLRDERKRREAGAKPRGETIAEQAKKLGISRAALVKRRQRESAIGAENVHTSSPLHSAENVLTSSPLHEPAKIIENQRDIADEVTHVHTSSPHKYSETISLATSIDPSEVLPEQPSETVASATAAPSGARPGMAAHADSGGCENVAPIDRGSTAPTVHAGSDARRDRRRPVASIVPPPRPVLIDGFAVQVFHWIGCGAHEAAAGIRRLAESGARGARAHDGIGRAMHEQHELLIKRMKRHGCDDETIWRALCSMDGRVCELSAEARERGIPLADLILPDDPSVPPPSNDSPDARAMRAAA